MSNQNHDHSIIEITLGSIVLLCSAFLAYKYKIRELLFHKSGSYTIYAQFDNVSGLNKGSDIEICGVVVGKVSNIELQSDNNGVYCALVSLDINNKVKIPLEGSSIKILNRIMGTNSILISCGNTSDDKILKHGDTLQDPGDSALSIESIVTGILGFLSPKQT